MPKIVVDQAGTYHLRLASLSGILQATLGVFFLAWSERS